MVRFLPGSFFGNSGLIALFAIVSSLANGQAQINQRSEIGFGLGTFNYTGDIARNYNFAFSRPAATVFYRHNLSKVVSFRTALTGGKISATDARAGIDAFTLKRNASFNITLIEVSGVFEYHFLDWREDKRKLRFTPYLFAGIGLFTFSGNSPKNAEYSSVQASIPFGGGIKYVLNPNWYIGIEFGIRKTFFDYLDNVSGGDPKYKNYNYGNVYDFDNYYFLGISLTRTFYDIPCPRSPY